MTIVIAGRGFSTCPDINASLNLLLNAMGAAVMQSYPERFK